MEHVDMQEATTGGSFNPSGENIDPAVLKSSIDTLKDFLGGCQCSDEIIGLALKKCNMDIE